MQKTTKKLNYWIILICILLGMAAIQQTYTTTNGYIRLWREPLLRLWKMNSFLRSEIIYLKPYGAKFMNFLDQTIPFHSSVTTIQNPTNFSQQNILQFYLGQDRTIIACPGEKAEMAACLGDPHTYVPVMEDFPPADLTLNKEFVPYNPDDFTLEGIESSNDSHFKGVFLANIPPTQSGTSNLTRPYHPALTLLLDVLIVSGIFILGFLLSGVILRHPPLLEILSLSIPLGSGLISWALFILSWIGIPLTLLVVLICYAALIAVLAYLRWKQVQSHPLALKMDPFPWVGKIKWSAVLIGIAIAFLGAAALVISIGRGYSTYDDMAIWSLKGYVMADHQTILAAGKSSGHGLAYPLNLSLNVAIFRLIDGDLLPGSKLIFFLLVISVLIGVYHFWRQHRIPRDLSLLGILLILSIPILYLHVTYGFANLPFTAFLVLGTLWSIRGFTENHSGNLMAGALLLAFAGWTRPEGIGYALTVAISLAIFQWLRRGRLNYLLPWLAVIVIIPGIWFIFANPYINQDQVGGAFSAMIPALKTGSFKLENLTEIVNFCIRRLEDTQVWGYMLPALILILIASIPRWIRRFNPAAFLVTPAAVITILGPVVLFYVEFFQNNSHFDFLITAFDRAFFPAAFFFAILVVLLAGTPTASPTPDTRLP